MEWWSCRIIGLRDGEMVELSNRRMVELAELSSRRSAEWWKGGVIESSNGGIVEWGSWSSC